ncbi:hypothetical protein GCM10020331_050910 [Ectobacillus funiculus]
MDGLILISRLNQEVIGYIDKFNVPYLIVNGTTDKDDIIQIVNQDHQGGQLVADHLSQLGHHRIGVIAGPQEHRSHKLRLQGFFVNVYLNWEEKFQRKMYIFFSYFSI